MKTSFIISEHKVLLRPKHNMGANTVELQRRVFSVQSCAYKAVVACKKH